MGNSNPQPNLTPVSEQITCPGCEGWGVIRDGKTNTIRCEVCKGEGFLEVQEVEAPPIVLGVLLAIALCIIVWGVMITIVVLQAEP